MRTKQKDIKKIKVGDYIYERYCHGVVIKVYKSGVLVLYSWKNWAGTFHEKEFIPYSELLDDDYILIQ